MEERRVWVYRIWSPKLGKFINEVWFGNKKVLCCDENFGSCVDKLLDNKGENNCEV